jgi:hypothetical protein
LWSQRILQEALAEVGGRFPRVHIRGIIYVYLLLAVPQHAVQPISVIIIFIDRYQPPRLVSSVLGEFGGGTNYSTLFH